MIVSIPWPLLRQIILVVAALVVVSSVTIIGRGRLRRLRRNLDTRIAEVYPYMGLLAVVLLINSYIRDNGQTLSWLIDLQITGFIFSIEGYLVAEIQSYATTELTAFFSIIYIYGYVFLMIFPFIAYLAMGEMRSFRKLMFAYAFNYTIGVLCYILFVAYGPRNLLYPQVESLMYIHWPQSQFVTGEINSNTNVFPSLHSSISLTVALLAYRTRRIYPGWLLVSVPIALCVVLSTMYLGIHWGTDVVAGAGLAVLSIVLTDLITDEDGENERLVGSSQRIVAAVAYPIHVGREWLGELWSRQSGDQSR